MAQQFETIALIGIGLIGSSIARDIREKQLAGTLVLPRETNLHAAVVFVHGSGKQTRNVELAEKFAAAIYESRLPLVPLREGEASLRLALAARQAADERREIRLSDAL